MLEWMVLEWGYVMIFVVLECSWLMLLVVECMLLMIVVLERGLV